MTLSKLQEVFTLDELQALKASLELGRRDNLTPVLSALALLLVGLLHHHDWTDTACILWGLALMIFFTRRHVRDSTIHKRAKTILEKRRP